MGRVMRRFHHTYVVVQLVCGMETRFVLEVVFMAGEEKEGERGGEGIKTPIDIRACLVRPACRAWPGLGADPACFQGGSQLGQTWLADVSGR